MRKILEKCTIIMHRRGRSLLLLLLLPPLVIKITIITATDMETEFQRKSDLPIRAEPGLKSNSPNSKASKCSFFPSRLLNETDSKPHKGHKPLESQICSQWKKGQPQWPALQAPSLDPPKYLFGAHKAKQKRA